MSNTQLLCIFFIVGLGLYAFVKIAQREPRDWHLKSFFLGGGKIGPDLTEHNTLDITFAWSGGIYFFALLAYQSGPWVMVLQLAWCFSIVVLALLLPRIIRRIRGQTIHGFLAEHYGQVAQVIAAVATTSGYVINAGYEFYWSALMLSSALGRPAMLLPLAVMFAVIAGTYCTIGGYRSNARTDKPQNLLGVASLALIVPLLAAQFHLSGVVLIASLIFAGGSVLYVVLTVVHSARTGGLPRRVLNTVAIAFAAVGFLVLGGIYAGAADGSAEQSLMVSKALSPSLLLGLLSFLPFFNVVDMQNWQQIAANEDMAESSYRDLSWSIVRATLYVYWFPSLGGVLIGTALRAYPGTLTDTTLFNAVFASLAPDLPDVLRGLLIGFIVLGLIATSLSTFDSFLMSALQTIRYDLFGRKRLSEIKVGLGNAEQKERAFVSLSRKLLIPIAVSMIVVFYYLDTAYPGQILNFQAVMYAAPLMLIAPLLLALFTQSESRSRHSFAVSLSLSLGLLILFGMFRAFSAEGASAWEKEWLPNLMPVTALAFTTAGIGLSALYWKARGR